MLSLDIDQRELYDEDRDEFINVPAVHLKLEHSLISLSKWESKWKKPFLSKEQMSREEVIDYIKFMTLTPNVPDIIYEMMSNEDIEKVNAYIQDSQTATWFGDDGKGKKKSNKVVTAELIYYWMIASNIPMSCEKWHLNRLMTLIQVCGAENAPHDKMKKRDLMARNRALNQARRAKLNSKG